MESLGGSPHPQGRQRPQAGATASTFLATGLTAEGARLVSCPAWQGSTGLWFGASLRRRGLDTVLAFRYAQFQGRQSLLWQQQTFNKRAKPAEDTAGVL